MRRLIGLLLVGLAFAQPALATPEPGWAHYGGDAGGMRYSPAQQITPENVDQLIRAWTYRTGELEARSPQILRQMKWQTTPVLQGGRLVPRKMVLRTYLAADRDGFAVMPGGLTRVSAKAGEMVVSMQRGGGSKDTWVLADGSVNDFSLLPAGAFQVPLTRGGGACRSTLAFSPHGTAMLQKFF